MSQHTADERVSEIDARQRQLETLRRQVASLEAELSAVNADSQWQAGKFYTGFYVTAGFVLGGIAAMVSLLVNVVGATVAGRHPLEIIRVYLTFPLGEQALRLATAEGTGYVIDDGMILALGCCLYIGTGMALGSVFHVVLTRLTTGSSPAVRLIWGTVLGAAVWIVNYYLILSWLQPLLFGGNWITDTAVLPWWVALATHLVFGWTMAVIGPFGVFVPYQRPTEQASASAR